jgi:prophage DNA circulation protein
MGRSAVRWQITGYLILRDKGIRGNLLSQIADMINALETDDAGVLIHPTLGEMLVMCERYSYSDKRTAGGYVEFDMQFVEAGSGILTAVINTAAMLVMTSSAAETSAATAIKSDTAPLQSTTRPQPGLIVA